MSLCKEAQSFGGPRAKPKMEAYPDYTKSLVNQRRQDPHEAGKSRAIRTGLTGAVLGALLARLMSDKPGAVLTGAAAGGVAGAIPGYKSGKREAESDYSKILFLRRRMGINEPGEYEALLRHPGLAGEFIQKMSEEGMLKKAGLPPVIQALLRTPAGVRALAGAVAGGAAGAGWGYKVTPRIGGYDDSPAATGVSGITGTILGATLGGLLGAKPGPTAKFLTGSGREGMRSAMVLPAGILSGEIPPAIIAAMQRSSKATQDMAKSTHEAAIPAAVKEFARSGVAKGMLGGAGVAGLGALSSGLTRARSEEEIRKNRGRGGMVAADFAKYLLPSLIGGGVVGSLGK